ncbi:MGS-like domain-containing protein [Micromonospora palomenae]|uniref:MGS-like domain-containing protein n=1 Tax=Micromonospora palomenae TaxID=1461247 RepID=A0A561VMY2_9ACTN|nr:MGS-like domain-containing protein [Micromonospora palomenae]
MKTLHPKIHGGLLADLRKDTHAAQLDEHGIAGIDLLVSNLYPFQATVASGASQDECVEQIDIGGPAMVRAAAKNHASVAVVTDPAAYPALVAALADGGFTLAQRRALAARAFADIAEYDVAVAEWFATTLAPAADGWPQFAGLSLRRRAVLRYGENPHQAAAVYADPSSPAGLPKPSSCMARRCPTTTTSTPTRPGGPPTTSPTSRRWRSSSTPTRAASRSARTWPRRTAGRTPATRCRRTAG